MDQTRVLFHASVEFYTKVPLVDFLGLVHFRIPLPLFVLGGAGCCDRSGIDDRALTHRHAPIGQERFDGDKNLLTLPMLLKQMAEGEDRGLVRDLIADQLNAGKAAHGGHLNQGLFHGRIAERIPLLQQMDAQHRWKGIGRHAAFLAPLGVVRLDQIDQCMPGHYRLHLRQELLAFVSFLGRGQLIDRETELLAAH